MVNATTLDVSFSLKHPNPKGIKLTQYLLNQSKTMVKDIGSLQL